MNTKRNYLAPATLPLSNPLIAERLDEVAHRLEGHDDNPFRVHAYRVAAETVRNLGRPAADILRDEGLDGLDALPGIGLTLATAIERLAVTGELAILDHLRATDGPDALLADLPGVGPELAKRIYEHFRISTLADLEAAANDGRLANFPGIGPKRLRGIRDVLAGRLSRRRVTLPRPADGPPVVELLEVDRIYRERAGTGCSDASAAAVQPGRRDVAAAPQTSTARPQVRRDVFQYRAGPPAERHPRLGADLLRRPGPAVAVDGRDRQDWGKPGPAGRSRPRARESRSAADPMARAAGGGVKRRVARRPTSWVPRSSKAVVSLNGQIVCHGLLATRVFEDTGCKQPVAHDPRAPGSTTPFEDSGRATRTAARLCHTTPFEACTT